MPIRRRAVLALWRLHLSRILKRQAVFAGTMAGLIVFVGLRRGWDHQMVPVLGLFLFFFHSQLPPMLMMREKLDGSLGFLGSLPISGHEHAVGRILTAATLAAPAAIACVVALVLYSVVPIAAVAPAAFGIYMLLTVTSVVGTALHYRYSVGEFMQRGLYSLLAFIALAFLLDELITRSWFPSLEALVRPTVLIAASMLSWAGLLAAGWWAVRTIARLAPIYQGEPDDELLAEVKKVERKWGRKWR